MSVSVKYRVGKSKLIQVLIVFFAFLITIPLLFIIFIYLEKGSPKSTGLFSRKSRNLLVNRAVES